MPYAIDETHDPNLESWVESANDPETDFPIQNLPLCVFSGQSSDEIGVRIGDQILRLSWLFGDEKIDSLATDVESEALAELFNHGGESWANYPSWHSWWTLCDQGSLRSFVSRVLRSENKSVAEQAPLRYALVSAQDVVLKNPITDLRDYTDFYASVFHATNVGSMFRPDNPLLPNYKWIPVGYHGRASSVVPSGTPIHRPSGQLAPAEDGGAPSFGPCKMLDYELELGVVMGRGNELGQPIPIGEAEDHILGVCLLNDWSARDMQKWEYQPLGPFLAKSFATSVSPYLVTMEALAPFRSPAMARPDGDPKPLPHLHSEHDQAHGGIDITLEVYLSSKQMRDKGFDPVRLSRGSFKDMYWTIAQMVTHHASNGCNMRPGDLLGSGTVSGPDRGSRGCLLELTWDGDPFAAEPKLVPGTQRTPIELPTGEQRKFLADGDEIVLKGFCERDGFRRIGFGECRGIIEPGTQSG
ncbi:MAG: fumarylacetoacetase [Planctomycetota bacterium]